MSAAPITIDPWEPRELAHGHTLLGVPTTDTWQPVDLAQIVAGIESGLIVGPVPTLLRRSDGRPLMYPGEVHSLAGEAESGKSWVMLSECAARIAAGDRVLFLDFETNAPSVVERLLALGSAPPEIIERFVYVRPDDPPADAAIGALAAGGFAVAVIDGNSEAYSLFGLDPLSNSDVATFLSRLPRPLANGGAAVVQIDHVTKDRETRGRYALGGQHKLAGIGVAFTVEALTVPSRTRAGLLKVRVTKDRHGHVRAHAQGDVIALAHITPIDGGKRVTVTLDPPDSRNESGEWRPTTLMEKVSRFVESEPGSTLNAVKTGVVGKNSYVGDALDYLARDGYIERTQQGQAQHHHSLRPYREIDASTEARSAGLGSDPEPLTESLTEARETPLFTGEIDRVPTESQPSPEAGPAPSPEFPPLRRDSVTRLAEVGPAV